MLFLFFEISHCKKNLLSLKNKHIYNAATNCVCFVKNYVKDYTRKGLVYSQNSLSLKLRRS